MLDAHRTLEFASAACRALEGRLFGNMLAEERRFVARSELVEVAAESQDDFLGIENLPGIVCRAMLGAASAFHARERLQRIDLRDVLAGIESEILVAFQRRNAAEARAPQEYRHRTQRQVQVFGVRNQRKKGQQADGVQPPIDASAHRTLAIPEAAEVRNHQGENQEGDESRFGRHGAQPFRLHQESADEQPGNRYGDGDRPDRDEAEIEAAERALVREEGETESGSEVIQGDQREGAESPEDEGMRKSGKRPLLDDLALRHDFPKELADARTQRRDGEIRRLARASNDL